MSPTLGICLFIKNFWSIAQFPFFSRNSIDVVGARRRGWSDGWRSGGSLVCSLCFLVHFSNLNCLRFLCLTSSLYTSHVFLAPLNSVNCFREIGSALNAVVSGQLLSIKWFLICQFKRITFFLYLFFESCVCSGLCYVWLDVHFQLGASWIFGNQSDSNPNFTHWNNQLWHFLLFQTVNYREFFIVQ